MESKEVEEGQEEIKTAEDSKPIMLKLLNVPKKASLLSLRKMVAERLQVSAEAIWCEKAPRWTHAKIKVKLPSLPEGAEDRLDGYEWEGSLLRLERQAKPAEGDEAARLNDQVTPLWRLPYAQQLSGKEARLQAAIKAVPRGPAYTADAIQGSPQETGYRNKCEFTVGKDARGQPCVGFTLGSYAQQGGLAVASSQDCVHVSERMKAVCATLQAFLIEHAERYPVHDRESRQGLFRLLILREHDAQLMAILQLSTVTEEARAELERSLVDLLGSQVQSLHVQYTQAVHNGIDTKAPYHLLHGQPVLYETIQMPHGPLRFEISPASFFQVNPSATALLYQRIRNYAVEHNEGQENDTEGQENGKEEEGKASERGILLDLCCGTGTIGLCLHAAFERVIGIELVPEAIADAQRNAQLNGIAPERVEFHAGRVEEHLTKVMATLPQDTPVTVVLDPPRAGIHKSVIKAIRGCERISRLVYVACNVEAVVGSNLQDLCKQEGKGKAFQLTRSAAIDLFPQTNHCEMVLQFNR